ncbi:MAG: alpha/beta fold hydrolase [Bacteroidales bacterium]
MIKQIIIFAIALMLGFASAGASNPIIEVKKTGQGQPMILIHGMACSAEVWNEVAGYYQDRYELHLVTIAGFGNSRILEAPHTLQAIRDALIAYVKEENLHKPILMGHSMGGFLALWAASEQPELFGPIVSVDGLPYFPVLAMPGISAETAAPMAEMMKKQMQNANPETARAQQEMMIATMMGDADKRSMVLEMGMRSNPAVIARAMGEMYTTDIRNQVHTIESPVLVLGSWYGYRQWGTTLESARNGFQAQFAPIANSRVEMAATALHFIFYDEPQWFFEMVDGFLEEK